MRVQRAAARCGETRMRLPETLQREHELAPVATALELRRSVGCTEPDGDAVRHPNFARRPGRPVGADRAYRSFDRHPPCLVERRSSHGSSVPDRSPRVCHEPSRICSISRGVRVRVVGGSIGNQERPIGIGTPRPNRRRVGQPLPSAPACLESPVPELRNWPPHRVPTGHASDQPTPLARHTNWHPPPRPTALRATPATPASPRPRQTDRHAGSS